MSLAIVYAHVVLFQKISFVMLLSVPSIYSKYEKTALWKIALFRSTCRLVLRHLRLDRNLTDSDMASLRSHGRVGQLIEEWVGRVPCPVREPVASLPTSKIRFIHLDEEPSVKSSKVLLV